MSAKHVALLTLLGVVGSGCALSAQLPELVPPDPSAEAASWGDAADQPADAADTDSQTADQDAGAPVYDRVDMELFYTDLAPYGSWVLGAAYGWVWHPYGISSGWRPYSLGYWQWTKFGWTWISNERFGWATYHYGRWIFDSAYGWIWVPGYEWSPAWVAWRVGGGYIGWAPLPPAAIRFGVTAVAPPPGSFCFVPERSFLDRRVATRIAPPSRNAAIVATTITTGGFTLVNGRVGAEGVPAQAGGPQVGGVHVAAGPPVGSVPVVAGPTGGGTVRPPGNQVAFRPAAVGSAATPPPLALGVAEWRPVAGARQIERVEQPNQPQTISPALAPARPLAQLVLPGERQGAQVVSAPGPRAQTQQPQAWQGQAPRVQAPRVQAPRAPQVQALEMQAPRTQEPRGVEQQRPATDPRQLERVREAEVEAQQARQQQAEQEWAQRRQAELRAQQERDQQQREQQHQAQLQAQQQGEQQQREQQRQAELQREQERQAEVQAQQQREQQRQAELQAEQQRQAEAQAHQQREQQQREQQRQAELQAQQQREQQQREQQRQAELQAQQQREQQRQAEQQREQQQRQAEAQTQREREQQEEARRQAEQQAQKDVHH